MKQKIKDLMVSIRSWQTRTLVIAGAAVLAIIATSVFAFYPGGKGNATQPAETSATGSDPIVAVVGVDESMIAGTSTSNNSWPGEIISLNNLQVQPDREGTISEWYVRIGQQVQAGQTLGKLSRPPQTPEAIMSLSEKSQMVSEARTSVEVLRTYTTKRIAQLKQLRTDTESSNKQKLDLLILDNSGSSGAQLSLIASKKRLAQGILRGSISEAFPIIMSNQTIVPDPGSNFKIQLKGGIGIVDSNLRNKFSDILFAALTDLKDKNMVPEKSGLAYFDTAIKLANASIADGEALSTDDLDTFKKMLIKDQSEFVATLGEIKSMELEGVNTQRESIDKRAEIDAMIADLEKELALSEGEAKAKEVAYNTVKTSITSGYSMVAPKSGIVSNIMKQPGEFVGPGMPVATVTANGNDGLVIRMSIPNNIQKPQIGELLSVMRPGFGTDIQKARLIGVGSSLNENGSYMADAVFTENTKWSVGASVRILAPASSSAVLIKYSSVFWGEGGSPTVWAISEADRIFSKKIIIGRTLGDSIEVYEGLANGDRYIAAPTSEIKEDMLLSEIVKEEKGTDGSAKSGEDDTMGGMEM